MQASIHFKRLVATKSLNKAATDHNLNKNYCTKIVNVIYFIYVVLVAQLDRATDF